MIQNKQGLAALFDALLFLVVVTMVSAALLSAFPGGASKLSAAEQEKVDAAQLVLLRSTVVAEGGNPYTVEEWSKFGDFDGRFDQNISTMLDLLLPGMQWRWSVERGDVCRSITSALGWTDGGDVFCSTVKAPLGDRDIVFRLEARPA